MTEQEERLEDLEERLAHIEETRFSEYWTLANFLREERFPGLGGDVENEQGSFSITVSQLTGAALFSNTNLTLANGANNNIDISTAAKARITGPSAGFSVSGFTGGSEGRILFLYNAVAQQMTITNDATSTAANRILTLTGADVVLRAGTSHALFQYDGTDSRWILVATN